MKTDHPTLQISHFEKEWDAHLYVLQIRTTMSLQI